MAVITYTLINRDDAFFYCYLIKEFNITSEEGKEKWTASNFTRNVYYIFIPVHFKRICSVVDHLHDPGVFDVLSGISFVSNLE
jgi:hypothetical protein